MEWRAGVTATGIPVLGDEQLEGIALSLGAVVRHEAERQLLHVVWRLEAPALAEATQNALWAVTERLRPVLGSKPQFAVLHVVAAELADAAEG